jgi:hypothetical protein
MNKNRKPKPVTGGNAGAKGQKAMVTAKYAKHANKRRHELDRQDACPTTERRKLVNILREFGVSVAGFNGLRADSYEKHLAGRSLADLRRFYEILVESCRGYREMAPECPTWGEDNKPPHWTTLRNIKHRIALEQTVDDLEDKLKQLDAVQARISGLPAETQARLLSGMVTYLSQELLNAKFDGQPIMENLKVMDRLLKAGSLRVRERREARSDARFAWEQAGKPINTKAESGKRPMIGSKAKTGEASGNVAKEDEYAGLTEDEKSERLLERAFGKNPYKNKPQPVTGDNHKDQDKRGDAEAGEELNDEPMIGSKSETKEVNANKAKGANMETNQVEDEYNKPNLPNGKPWWWQEGTILISGPSKEFPKGIGRDVVTNLPYCVATGRPVYLATN